MSVISLGESTKFQTEFGTIFVHHLLSEGKEGVAIIGEKPFADPVPVRIQSSCLFSESFLTLDCDCADQLHESLKIIVAEGGLLIYLYEEGRGAGLKSKLEGIKIQQELNCDTVTAFKRMKLPPDIRDYKVATGVILSILGNDRRIELLTNNPTKIKLIQDAGVNIVSRRSVIFTKSETVVKYLREKSQVLGHIIEHNGC
jgi:GTP cyclohydrolase II